MRMTSRRTRPILTRTLALVALCALPAVVTAQVERPEQIEYPELPEFDVPEPTRIELDNGMVLILIEDHELPLIDVVARIRTGQRLDPPERAGLAGLTGAVMRTGGTAEMTGDEIDEFLENRAASVETGIGIDAGTASMSCLKEDFGEVLEIFAQVLESPQFDEDRIAVAKNQVNTAIARQNDDPQQILFREFNKVIRGADSPYTRPDTYASVARIERDDLLAFHARYFHPNNIILGVVGDFETDAMVERIQSVFGDWPRGPESQPFEGGYKTEPTPGVFYVEKNDVTQSSILIGHLGVRRDNPDYYAIEVFNELLGGGFASRLFTRVRSQQGLAYAVSGRLGSNWDREGTFQLFTTTKTETTGAAIESLIAEATKVAADEPPTEEEVARAKRAILQSFVFTSDSSREILGQQLTYEYYGFPLDWLERYIDGIRDVTTQEVREVAARYVAPENFSITVVGPAEGRDRPLEDFGPVTALDITIPDPPAPEIEATPETRARGTELVGLAVEAHGGREALAAFENIRQQATAVASMQGQEQQVEVDQLVVYPDAMRQAITMPQGTMVQVVTAADAFTETPMGVSPMPAARRESVVGGLRRTLPVLLREAIEGHLEVYAAETGEVGDHAVQYLVVESGGERFKLAIDLADGSVRELVYRGADFSGTPGEVRQRYSDYRSVGDLSLPFAVEATFEGEPHMRSTINQAEVNQDIDPAQFQRPETP